jgi:hypothetical protein
MNQSQPDVTTISTPIHRSSTIGSDSPGAFSDVAVVKPGAVSRERQWSLDDMR